MALIRHSDKVRDVRKYMHPGKEPQRFNTTSRVIHLFIKYSIEAALHGYRIYRSGYGFRISLNPKKIENITPRNYGKYKFSSKAFGWLFPMDVDMGDLVKIYGYRFIPHKELQKKIDKAMETDLVYKILK